MNRPAETEKPRSWKATNDTTYPLGCDTDLSLATLHSTVVVSGGSCPTSTRRSCSRETLERVHFDIGTAKSWAGWKHKQQRRGGCRRTRSAEGKCERKKMGRQSPEPAPDARF
jgi:hypothetical protein